MYICTYVHQTGTSVCTYVHTYVCTYVCVLQSCVYLFQVLVCMYCMYMCIFTYVHVGEHQYKSRLEDIRILKIEVKKLRREKNILSRSVANIEDLRYVHTCTYCVLSSTPENCYVCCACVHAK